MARAEPERLWGRLPNVYRHAPTMEQLRHDPRVAFEGLPPVDQLVLAGPESHRYVRQDDPLWDQLHTGVLTTGLVRGALGLYEKTTAKKLGIPSGRSGHGELLKAYHHLCHQPPSSSGGGTSADVAAAAAAAAHNAAAVVAFNAAKGAAGSGAANGAASSGNQQRRQDVLQGPAAVATEPAAAGPEGQAAEGKSKGAKKRLRKKQAKAAAALLAAGLSPPQQGAPADDEWGISEERKLRKGRALSSLGLLAICCSWGSAQEAAALLQVAGAFPTSQLAEVGLCRLQPELLPASWGFAPGSLPPMGASPDALIRHHVAAPAAASAGTASAAGSTGDGSSTAQAATAVNGAAASPAAVGPWDIDGLLERLQLAGTEDSPGAAATSSTGSSSSGGGGGGGGGSGASINGATSTNGMAGRSSGAARSSGAGYLIEVVEVKNTCPFGHSRRGGRLRTNEFAVADKGPRQGVPPEWVPQIQLHMLCAGTPSGLLVSRSATKGTRVFRLRRDDELLRLMLLVISRLWQQHVLRGQPPPPGVYASWREHHDMVRSILEVARGAQLVATIEEGYHLPGGDSRWFLD